MASHDLLLDDVLADCPGCTIALARYAIKRACNELYRKGRPRRTTIGPFNVSAVEAAANIVPGFANGMLAENQMLLELEKVWWFDAPLEVRTINWIEDMLGPDWKSQIGTPRYVVQETLDSLRLAPHLDTDATDALRIALVYGPNDVSASIDDDLYQRFKLELAAGAKGYLMAMSKKPWSDAQMAGVWREVFNKTVNGLANRTAFGPAGAPRTTTPCF